MRETRDTPLYRCPACKITWEWNHGTYTLVEGAI